MVISYILWRRHEWEGERAGGAGEEEERREGRETTFLRKHCIAPLWNWGQNMSWNEKYPPTFTSCSCKGTTIKFTREIHSRELFVKLNSVTVPRHAKWKTSKRRKRGKVQLHRPSGLVVANSGSAVTKHDRPLPPPPPPPLGLPLRTHLESWENI